MEIPVIRNVLEANGKLAASLKDQFAKHGILALNLIGAWLHGCYIVILYPVKGFLDSLRIFVWTWNCIH